VAKNIYIVNVNQDACTWYLNASEELSDRLRDEYSMGPSHRHAVPRKTLLSDLDYPFTGNFRVKAELVEETCSVELLAELELADCFTDVFKRSQLNGRGLVLTRVLRASIKYNAEFLFPHLWDSERRDKLLDLFS
jgi:hypothetical protein